MGMHAQSTITKMSIEQTMSRGSPIGRKLDTANASSQLSARTQSDPAQPRMGWSQPKPQAMLYFYSVCVCFARSLFAPRVGARLAL